jgi:hypothetical protein
MPSRPLALLCVALLISACGPDCDWDAEVEALLLEGTVDCGWWDRTGDDDEPIECARDAAAQGLDYRFDWSHRYGHATTFTRNGAIYVVYRLDGGPFPPKTDTGIEVSTCPGTLDDSLPDFEDGSGCSEGERICNVCPGDGHCDFPD